VGAAETARVGISEGAAVTGSEMFLNLRVPL
jgi:hypothetical protein